MGPARRFLAGITFLLVPLSAPAADLAPPVPVCFERLPDGTVSAKATGGGRFQVIPAGGLDNQAVWFQNSVIRRGDTIKAAGAQIQQYVEVEEITPEAVVLKNRGWARGIGEFDNTTRTGFGCGPVPPAPAGEAGFRFAGLKVTSDLGAVATGFPHSRRAGDYLYVAPQDSRDHIYGIELSGTGESRRLRISFERPLEVPEDPDSPRTPPCNRIQEQVERQYGPPRSVREFAEESARRSDRQWERDGEQLTLVCHGGTDGLLCAEAVVIVRIPGNP
ncbi:MAG TPA: hypothetical protein VJ386_11100 [Candidatus Deferrimicrobiaceae bacterium]|nr:hypothetical protein [Candidatus Deferrimicrobiaceae bacterium]